MTAPKSIIKHQQLTHGSAVAYGSVGIKSFVQFEMNEIIKYVGALRPSNNNGQGYKYDILELSQLWLLQFLRFILDPIRVVRHA
jgi:hypothetical protein